MALKGIYFRERPRHLGALLWPPEPAPNALTPRQWLAGREELFPKGLKAPWEEDPRS